MDNINNYIVIKYINNPISLCRILNYNPLTYLKKHRKICPNSSLLTNFRIINKLIENDIVDIELLDSIPDLTFNIYSMKGKNVPRVNGKVFNYMCERYKTFDAKVEYWSNVYQFTDEARHALSEMFGDINIELITKIVKIGGFSIYEIGISQLLKYESIQLKKGMSYLKSIK